MIKIISLLLCLILLCACGTHSVTRTITDHDVNDIVDDLENSERFISLEKQDINFLLSLAESDYQNAWILLDQYGTTIDEIGIFYTTRDKADMLYQKLENYIKSCQNDKKEWLESYNPNEAQKLKNARLFRYDTYMGYAFLSDFDQNEFLKEIDDFFKGKENTVFCLDDNA